MRTSLIEIREIEKYLDNRLAPGERLVFEARMEVNSELKENIVLQKKVYALLQANRDIQLRKMLNSYYALFSKNSRKRNQLLSIFD